MFHGIFDNSLPFVSLGKGKKTLVILPGLLDSLYSVTMWRWFCPHHFRFFMRYYKIYIVGIKKSLPMKYKIEDMAFDYQQIIEKFPEVDILGIDMGSYIAQHIAQNSNVRKLILVSSSAKLSQQRQSLLELWIQRIKEDKWRLVSQQIIYQIYNTHYKYFSSFLPAPKYSNDFIVAATACLEHNSLKVLGKITCPTIIIGNSLHSITTEKETLTLAENIAKSEILWMECEKNSANIKQTLQRCIVHFLQQE